MDRMGARECYREVILDNIEYSYLVQDSHIDREQLDEIVDLIVDTVCSARKVIRIAGDDYPADVVKSRFMKPILPNSQDCSPKCTFVYPTPRYPYKIQKSLPVTHSMLL